MRLAQVLVLGFMLSACSGGGGSGTGGGSGGSSAGGGTGGGGGGGSAGTQNCVWLGNCVDPCAANDQACLNACAAQATPSAISTWNAYADCTNTHNCTDTACINTFCSAELAACTGNTGTGGGAGGGGGATGYTTSGSCRVDVTPPSIPPQAYCWDYELTVSGTHNDGTEHYYYFDSVSVVSGQTDCTSANNRTFTGPAGGSFDPATVSASNKTNKQRACSLQHQPPTITAVWSDSPCVTAGSLGHCTWSVTNTYDSGASTVTSLTTTTWTVP